MNYGCASKNFHTQYILIYRNANPKRSRILFSKLLMSDFFSLSTPFSLFTDNSKTENEPVANCQIEKQTKKGTHHFSFIQNANLTKMIRKLKEDKITMRPNLCPSASLSFPLNAFILPLNNSDRMKKEKRNKIMKEILELK